MKLIIKKAGLELLKPSRTYERQVRGEQGQGWQKTKRFWPHKKPMPCTIEMQSGSHEVERIENPFIPGGEPWLVLKGSRIGAAESYLRGLSGLVAVSE
jgi:hypothetical protein